MKQLSEFSVAVIAIIRKVPKGKIATYKQIAALAGKPHASRAVSWILHSCSEPYHLPWHRILNSQGKISFPISSRNYLRQKKRLQKEGVAFSERGQIDLAKFQWKKKSKSNDKKPQMRTHPK